MCVWGGGGGGGECKLRISEIADKKKIVPTILWLTNTVQVKNL